MTIVLLIAAVAALVWVFTAGPDSPLRRRSGRATRTRDRQTSSWEPSRPAGRAASRNGLAVPRRATPRAARQHDAAAQERLARSLLGPCSTDVTALGVASVERGSVDLDEFALQIDALSRAALTPMPKETP